MRDKELFRSLGENGLRVMVVLVMFLVLQLGAQAQATGAISGTVNDSSDAIVVKAKIVLKNEATSDERQTLSNQSGYFAFAAVGSGTYTLRVESPGFKAWEVKGLAMNAGDKRHYMIKLEIGSVQNEVTVAAGDGEITRSIPANGARCSTASRSRTSP
jgi:hypothetical protein